MLITFIHAATYCTLSFKLCSSFKVLIIELFPETWNIWVLIQSDPQTICNPNNEAVPTHYVYFVCSAIR